MSRVIQNARDHITELVNIAIAYDLPGSFNTPAFQFVLKGIALRLQYDYNKYLQLKFIYINILNILIIYFSIFI